MYGGTERDLQLLAVSRVAAAIERKRSLLQHVFRIDPRPQKRVLDQLATDLSMLPQDVEDCFFSMRQETSLLHRKRKVVDAPCGCARKCRSVNLPLAALSDGFPSNPMSNSSSVATSRVPSVDSTEDMDMHLAAEEAVAEIDAHAIDHAARNGEHDRATLTGVHDLIALKGEVSTASTASANQAVAPSRPLDGDALALATLHRFGRVQVIMEADAPYKVASVSQGWERLCGIPAAHVKGKTLSMLQGPLTNGDAVTKLVDAARQKMTASVPLVNYNHIGQPFEHVVYVDPLCDPSGETRYIQATSLVVQAPGEFERPSELRKDEELKFMFAKAHMLMLVSREEYTRICARAGSMQVLPCHRDC